MPSATEFAGLVDGLRTQWDDVGQWLYFKTIFDFIDSEIRTFQGNLLDAMLRWVGGMALALMTLWMLWQGYRIVQGKAHNAMELVTSGWKAALIVTAATGMMLFHADLYTLLTDTLPGEITQVMTGQDKPALSIVDDSLNTMQAAMAGIDVLNVHATSENLKADVDRVAWLAGMGAMGPAVMGGALLVSYKVALALFIGLAPLFILCLLFQPTQALFQKWLLYGLGTLFSQGLMAFMAVLATKIVVAVGGVLAAQYALAASTGMNTISVSSAAMLQGGIGFLLTLFLLTIPAIAAQFFQGTLGSFMAYSVFGPAGGGGRRRETEAAASSQPQSTAPRDADPTQDYARRMLPTQAAQPDEIKRLTAAPTEGEEMPVAGRDGSFTGRYLSALASNEWVGGGDPLPAHLIPKGGEIYGTAQDKLHEVLVFQANAEQAHREGRLSDHDYAAARHTAGLGFYAEFDRNADAYADRIARDPSLTMQEKYDRLHGLGGRVIALAECSGIDYHVGAAAQTTAAADAVIQRYGLFDPGRPTRVYVDDAANANEPLRALLGLRPGEDMRSRLLNPRPGEVYVTGPAFHIESEPWREHYDLVGQVVQQSNVTDVVAGVVAQRALEGAEALSGQGRDPDSSSYDRHVENRTQWVARNDEKLGRVEALTSAIGFAKDVYVNSQDNYLTVDVFASKKNPEERWFQVRTFDWDIQARNFKQSEPPSNASIIEKITGH